MKESQKLPCWQAFGRLYLGVDGFVEKEQSLIDYAIGVEVGLDSNARKSRSGTIFEKEVCQKQLEKAFKNDEEFDVVYQDKKVNLWKQVGKRKIHDFVIYRSGKPFMIVECTYIGTSGSKPTAIAESYPTLSKLALEKGYRFMWVIDGMGWKKQKGDMISALQNIDIMVIPPLIRGSLLSCLR